MINKKELYQHYTIDINVYDLIQESYIEDFKRGINVIGCSSIPFCSTKTCISKIYFPGERIGNMRMLHGKIHHAVIQRPKVLNPLVYKICDILGFDKNKIKIVPELAFRILIKPDHPYTGLLEGKKTYMEGHIDIYTSFFLIEIKTTDASVSQFRDAYNKYHVIQLNTYLGHSKVKTDDKYKTCLGYLLKMNLQSYRSPIEDINEIWDKFGKMSPIIFDKEVFEATIEKTKMIFKMIDKGKYNLAGPEYDWECGYCDDKVKRICGRKKMKEGTIIYGLCESRKEDE